MGGDWRDGIWISIDTETTGPDPATAKVVEFAATRYSRGAGFLARNSALVNPCCGIPAEATAIHGITDEAVSGRPPLADLGPRLQCAFAAADVIIGYNVYGYDWPLLQREFGPVVWDLYAGGKPLLDVLAMVRMDRVGRFWKGTGRHKLTSVSQRYGVAHDHAHRALGDTDAVVEVLVAMLTRERALAEIPTDGHEAEERKRRAEERKLRRLGVAVLPRREVR